MIRAIAAVATRARQASRNTDFFVRQIAVAESRPVRRLHCGLDIAAKNVDLREAELATVADCSAVVEIEDADTDAVLVAACSTDVARVAVCLRGDLDNVVQLLQQLAVPLDTIRVLRMRVMDVTVAAIWIAVVSKHVDELAANCSAVSRKNHHVAGTVANAGCSIMVAAAEAATRAAPKRLAVAIPLYLLIPVAVARLIVEQDV